MSREDNVRYLGTPRTSVAVRHRPSAVIAVADIGFHQEVLDALERDPRLEVRGAATTAERAAHLLRIRPSDVVLLCPRIARDLRHPTTRLRLPRTLIVATEMTVPVLREAIEIGAHAVYAWPDERQDLLDAVAVAPTVQPERGGRRAKVVAILGTRGGAGTTFFTCNLAAVLADGGLDVCVVDLDHRFGELALALGVSKRERWRTIADLVPVADELSPEHVEDALVAHQRGFRALLAPRADAEVSTGLYAASVALLAGSCGAVLLHVPRGVDELTRTALSLADETVVVASPDLFSLHGARRLVAAVDDPRVRERFRLVVNRTGRRVRGEEFGAVAGMDPFALIRSDRRVPRLQDRGELLKRRARRAGKDLRSAAAAILPEAFGSKRETA